MHEKLTGKLNNLEKNLENLRYYTDHRNRKQEESTRNIEYNFKHIQVELQKRVHKDKQLLQQNIQYLKTQNSANTRTRENIYKNLCLKKDEIRSYMGRSRHEGDKLFADFGQKFTEISNLQREVDEECKKQNKGSEYAFTKGSVYCSLLSEDSTLGTVEKVPSVLHQPVNLCWAEKRKLKDINVSHPGDGKKSWVTGMICISYGVLLLTDSNNCKIKKISGSSGHILSFLRVTSEPWDITSIEPGLAAVTMPHEQQIIIISTKDNLCECGRFRVKGQCLGISATPEKLFVSIDPNEIQILDHFGNFLFRLDLPKGTFQYPKYICVMPKYDKDEIYISDGVQCNVTKISTNGRHTTCSTIFPSDTKSPAGITLMEDESLLLCWQGGNKVLVIPSNNEKKIVLLHDGIVRPQCVCYDPEQRIVYVSFEDENILKAYQLS